VREGSPKKMLRVTVEDTDILVSVIREAVETNKV
jgi:hypothetical protein